jgi:acyl dehydratase
MSENPDELALDLWRWTARHPEWHPGEFGSEVACFALRSGGDTILIDPLLPPDPAPVLELIEDTLGDRLSILITIPYHVRSSEAIWRRFGKQTDTSIWGHPASAKRLDDTSAFKQLDTDTELPAAITAHPIGKPRRHETPLHVPSHKALVFGDAVAEVDGRLVVWGHREGRRQGHAVPPGPLQPNPRAAARARLRPRSRDTRRAGAGKRPRSAPPSARQPPLVPPRLGSLTVTITVNGIEELKALQGRQIGPGEWREVTQADINTFAELSRDHQWIHVDVERARTESPFGTTVAHGNLTLSMIDGFRPQLLESTGFKLGVNYGWNKIRFPAPVPAGSRVRASVETLAVDDMGGGWHQITQRWTVEVEGSEKPACVAESVGRVLV